MITDSIDADLTNADWTKQAWDLPSYRSPEFMELVPDLDQFRKTPVYKHAVEIGLIHDDEWVADWVQSPIAAKLHKAIKRKPIYVPTVSSDRLEGKLAVRKLTKIFTEFFDELKEQVLSVLSNAEKLVKQEPLDKEAIDDVMGQIDFTVFNQLPKKLQPILKRFHSSTGTATVKVVGVAVKANKGVPELNPNAFDQVNELAVEYAHERSAELVGMKYVEGELVENPNAVWRIDEATREGIRSSVAEVVSGGLPQKELSARLSAEYGFSHERAETIAITEVHRANGQGAYAGYKASGVVGKKVWFISESENSEVCDECDANAEEGPIPLDDEFPSGDLTEPAHPKCHCAISGSIDWGNEED